MNNNHQKQNGFVLITSLIFLVVITLLAVSAINSSTLQERMASNLRDKSRARQAADTALSHAELLLLNLKTATNTCLPKGKAGACAGGLLYISPLDGMFSIKPTDESTAFLDSSIWSSANALTYNVDTALPTAKFFVEYIPPSTMPCDTSSASNTALQCAYYRITARAQGQNPAAVAVTQSIYKKIF